MNLNENKFFVAKRSHGTNTIAEQRQTIFEKEAEINSLTVNDADRLIVGFMTLDLEKEALLAMRGELNG
ncbi:hypothetical protein [Lentilactobacillus farraginis]|uniref:Uncharacterized protein n=1 Tax=Lentilactobacillus farraginis DSM 18382 = JCM 14108 TaxID=1423743 RepID=X0QH48_9LACO|nr:hypothetical protein [Lentilactobacillus farraginis]KRM05027.1 hypothetical protein FD41_GL000793 [Lentilactobacillus farraginis DSM 18382 = JCM 14108]GAF37940.1 hypothetical protein JCM14108_3028 [Lentilactobacillus farraginis DSM 18382 = JCM 14108]